MQFCALAVGIDDLRYSVGKTPRTDVVNRHDGIVFVHGPTGVDDLLRAALHFGIATLYRRKIKRFISGAGRCRGCCAAAKTDQHGRTAEYNDTHAVVDFMLIDVRPPDVAEAAGYHDGLVVAPSSWAFLLGVSCCFKSPEIAAERRTSEFVVVASRSERRFEHDIERRSDSAGAAVMFCPTVVDIFQVEV